MQISGSGVGQRLDWLDESAQLMRDMLRDGVATARGERYHSVDARNDPAPVQPFLDRGPELVDALIHLMDTDNLDFASAVAPICGMDDFLDPNVVKVVCDARGDALYFSRAPIPWPRGERLEPGAPWPPGLRALKHIGIYAYRREALLELAGLPRSEAEVAESLEQLRVLDQGWKMRILEWEYEGIGVDTESDLQKIRNYIKQK